MPGFSPVSPPSPFGKLQLKGWARFSWNGSVLTTHAAESCTVSRSGAGVYTFTLPQALAGYGQVVQVEPSNATAGAWTYAKTWAGAVVTLTFKLSNADTDPGYGAYVAIYE